MVEVVVCIGSAMDDGVHLIVGPEEFLDMGSCSDPELVRLLVQETFPASHRHLYVLRLFAF